MFVLHVCEVYIYIYICVCVCIHTHTYTYIPLAKTWMDLEGIMPSKIIETGKDKYHMISFIYGLRKRKKPNPKATTKLIYSEERLIVARGGG